jgi:cytochrome P450
MPVQQISYPLDAEATRYLTDPSAHISPWTFFDVLRATAPVYRTSLGPLLISRHRDVSAVLTDDRWSVQQAYRSSIDSLFDREDPAAIFLSGIGKSDNPVHYRLRRLLGKWFTPRAVAQWSALIGDIIAGLLDEAAERGEMDLMADFALPIPQRVMSEVLGVPYGDRDQLQEWGLAIINRPLDGGSDAARRTLTDAFEQMCGYLDELIQERRKHLGEDLLSALIQTREGTDQLSPRELVALCTELISGGHETTSNLIANGAVLLMQNPDQCRRLLDDPSLTRGTIEESLRIQPPTMYSHPRLATEKIEISGVEIDRGEIVFALYAAANRDPEQFSEPARFLIDRPNSASHLSVAGGIHFCLGAILARIEAVQAIPALFRRFPRMEMVSPEIEWKRHMRMHGPARLPVRL